MGEEEKTKTGARRLVIVEDEDSLRSMYVMKFEQAGFSVEQAGNGEDGLDLIRRTKPDIVLLDILMPKVSGFDVLRSMKADKDKSISDIPVIFLTNLAEDAGYKQGQDLGAAGYVMKVDRTPEELVQFVNATIPTSGKK
jgi:DNA-binding response OmpR family regulator